MVSLVPRERVVKLDPREMLVPLDPLDLLVPLVLRSVVKHRKHLSQCITNKSLYLHFYSSFFFCQQGPAGPSGPKGATGGAGAPVSVLLPCEDCKN